MKHRNSLVIIFLLLGLHIVAQPFTFTGRVFDEKSGESLPFVNITYNHTKNGCAADIDGRFTLITEVPVTSLTFSFLGYEKKVLPIDAGTKQPLQVFLKEAPTQLYEVVVVAGENPAHRIIRNASRNRSTNNPTNLEAFQYESYNKLIVTLEADSAFLNNPGEEDKKMQDFINRQHLFLMESVSERRYKKPGKDNERITANRVSGFKNPDFVLLASQFQSFSFYGDFITILDKDYLNPISAGSTKKYFFELTDTVFKGTDTTFIIRFEPRLNQAFEGMKGLLYINSKGWAIQNVIAEPLSTGGFGVKIQQLYELFPGGSWFPVQLNYDLTLGNASVNGVTPVGIGRTYLKNIQINPPLQKSDFSVVDVKMDKDASGKDDQYWNTYRVDSLDEKEKTTYVVIDSIGEAEKFDAKLRWVTALSEGKLRVGIFDLPMQHWMRLNVYEGFRLGFGAETNSKLSERYKAGGYFAYGFSDKVWKYGYYGEVKLNREQNVNLGGGYRYDIFESGGDQWLESPPFNLASMSNIRPLWIEQFDQLSEVYAYLTWHPIPRLHTRAQWSRQNRYMPGDYAYRTSEDGIPFMQNGFVATVLQLYAQYSPNDRYMETSYGRKPVQQTFPVFTAQYSQGIPGVMDGTLDFQRLDVKIYHAIKTVQLGISSLEIRGGKVWGEVPYSYLFNGRANLPSSGFSDVGLFIADQFSFETMRNNEFLSDQYVQLMFRQNFQSRLLHIKKWKPDVEWMIRGLWGSLQNPELHQGIGVREATGFYETGLEINRIMGTLGVGAYYRFGGLQLEDELSNWSIKLTARFRIIE